MVKAFSYGLGTYDVAQLLAENNVDYLGVANTYEGIELRKAGIVLPIMIMKPEVDSFDLVIANNLTPTIFSIPSLKTFIATVDNKTSTKISLKLDTGMHRLGFQENEIQELIELLKENEFIQTESIFSHLAAAENREEDDFTLAQIAQFEKITASIAQNFDYHIDKHILNSSGIVRFNAAQYDMVRLGIGLYGVSADIHTQKQLKSASSLQSKIAQIKNIKKGETIGYGRKGLAKSDMKIATIPVGYADGLSRALGNGKWSMIIHDQYAPIIGNVCMDMVMVNVSKISCTEGDQVTIFSDKNSISEMAKCIATIPYEILTSYSPRVKRVFSYR